MDDLNGRHIILGVTGSIAAFKAAALASELTKAGAEVRALLTESASRFVSAETFRGLTGRPAATTLWRTDYPESDLGHVELAGWADAVIVAPASAHTIARIALGLADDQLTTVILATKAQLLIVPAMETGMWNHPATQGHVRTLQERGATLVGPMEGRLASGTSGSGRMVEPAEILVELRRLLPDRRGLAQDLKGVHIVVSAGPTREPIDPVRYISNRSSGKMGYEIAKAAYVRGAEVTLVSGPVDADLRRGLPTGVLVKYVETAAEMKDAVNQAARAAEVVIMSAAVADFRPKSPSSRKVKKSKGMETVTVEATDDILTDLRRSAPKAVRIGFAAETEDLAQNAAEKLLRKGLAFVVANDVSGRNGPVFGSDSNRVTIVHPGGKLDELPALPKRQVAHRILDYLPPLLSHKAE